MRSVHLSAQSIQLIEITSWDPDFPESPRKHQMIPWKEVPIFHQIWSFLRPSGTSASTILQPDNYEFPFQFCLSKQISESIEGLEDCYVRYNLKAQICGGGNESTAEVNRRIRIFRIYPSLLFLEPQVRPLTSN